MLGPSERKIDRKKRAVVQRCWLLPLDSWTTLDLSVSFDSSKLPPSPLGAFAVNLVVNNLLDQRPPLVLSNDYGLGYDSANASPIGRFMGVRLTKAFR